MGNGFIAKMFRRTDDGKLYFGEIIKTTKIILLTQFSQVFSARSQSATARLSMYENDWDVALSILTNEENLALVDRRCIEG